MYVRMNFECWINDNARASRAWPGRDRCCQTVTRRQGNGLARAAWLGKRRRGRRGSEEDGERGNERKEREGEGRHWTITRGLGERWSCLKTPSSEHFPDLCITESPLPQILLYLFTFPPSYWNRILITRKKDWLYQCGYILHSFLRWYYFPRFALLYWHSISWIVYIVHILKDSLYCRKMKKQKRVDSQVTDIYALIIFTGLLWMSNLQ